MEELAIQLKDSGLTFEEVYEKLLKTVLDCGDFLTPGSAWKICCKVFG